MIRVFAILIYGAALMLGTDLCAADAGSSSLQTVDPEVEQYFRFNKLTNSAALRVGMKLEDAIKLLGEPTGYLQGRGMVKGKPEYPFEGWLRWYHNPRDYHVAPVIKLRIEKRVVKEVIATRG